VLKEERICGIVRLTLCGDCLKYGIAAMIARRLNKNGKPVLFCKKEVELLRLQSEKLDSGIFEDSPEMEELFLASFHLEGTHKGNPYNFLNKFILLGDKSFYLPYITADKRSPEVEKLFTKTGYGSLPVEDIPVHLHTPLMERMCKKTIEPPYVLWVAGRGPFSSSIDPTFESTGHTQADLVKSDQKQAWFMLMPVRTCLSIAHRYFLPETVAALGVTMEIYENDLAGI
jgi:hypothetical protein